MNGKTFEAYQRRMKTAANAMMKSFVGRLVADAWAAVQTQIDEEGCGPAMAAMKEWNE